MYLFWSKNGKANIVLLCHFIVHQVSLPMNLNFFKNKFNVAMESATQRNSFLTVLIGDFNARSSKWWTDDKTTQECLKKENLLSLSLSLPQLLYRSAFSNQQNLITVLGVHPSLHSNCQIIYGKF